VTEEFAGTVHPYPVYTLNDDETKKELVGGSYDNISALTIACAVFGLRQSKGTDEWLMVGVFDDAGTLIARIGKQRPAPTQTLPAGPAPVLTALQPDSAGNWNAEVHAIGQNFTAESVAWSGSTQAVTTYISPTEVSFVVPGVVAAGAYPVTIKNGALESNALTFTAL